MQGSSRLLNILALAVLVLLAGAIQAGPVADPEADPVVVSAPPAIETQRLQQLG
ncbi:hypothetical protein [Parasedimentitalea psychrophila]|uniref:Uncharacterized protein n=1 Tax=Parasedimentitalea psychrophila TaxID=2997337 RepID=A0A9Y2KVK7_9RHOB|nr:hypothetical protein [Parasedimentitalea psychrophila]WIY23960.1 hypothetical protein QPJ95_15180 [Parasedimentitalea psychrophila]